MHVSKGNACNLGETNVYFVETAELGKHRLDFIQSLKVLCFKQRIYPFKHGIYPFSDASLMLD